MNLGILSLLVTLDIAFLTRASSGPECSHTYLGRVGHGKITSYNFPFNYRHNLTCQYSIVLNAPPEGTKKICLTFHRFQLETSTPFCSFDYLKLDYVNFKYCGTGLWQYGVQTNSPNSNVWSRNFCWTVKGAKSFDLTFSSDNNINGPGFYTTYSVYDGANSDNTHQEELIGQAPCVPEAWTCFNRKCIQRDLLCNGADDCGDGSDESYSHARCGEQNVLACDFSPIGTNSDGYCGFTHEGWFRTSEKHSPYGPQGDHTNGTHGFYVYSDVNQSSAYLLSPELTLTRNRTYCLAFWYFVYGRPPAAVLRVYTGREQAYSRPEWSRRYTEGNEWLKGEVTVRTDAPLQVIFSAELDNSFSGVALDDISVMKGACGGNDISCNFESSLCGWSSAGKVSHHTGELDADLSWKIHSRLLGSNGPFYDHSSRDGGGYYLYLNHSTPKISSNNRALFVSPPVAAPRGQRHCLRFYYFMMGMDKDCCQLRVKLHGADDTLSDSIWSHHGEIRNVWIAASVQLDTSAPYQIVLEGMVNQASRGDIGIDELVLQPGACPVLTEGACTVGQYLCADGKCINATKKCDGVTDCVDSSDEDWRAGCPTPTPLATTTVTTTTSGPCPPTQFRCAHDDSCVPRDWLCDTFNDCGDMSDESAAAGCPVSSPPHAGCRPGTYSCHSGQCVPDRLKCDGRNDCPDSSDEDWRANCTGKLTPSTACKPDEFRCESDMVCISKNLVCDGHNDCGDNSDEEGRSDGCPTAVAVTSGLGTGAIIGIVFGCILCIVLVIISALLGRRRRKPPPRRRGSQRCTSRSDIATISCADDASTMERHMNMLEAMRSPMQSGVSGLPPYTERNHENRGYSPDASSPAAEPATTSNGTYPPDEPPPPYDAVLKEQMSNLASQAQERIQNAANSTAEGSPSRCGSGMVLPPAHTASPIGTVHPQNSARESDFENIYEELASTLGRPSPAVSSLPQLIPPELPPHPMGLHSPPLRTLQQPRVRLGTTALNSRMNHRPRNYYNGYSDSEKSGPSGFQRGAYHRNTGPPALGSAHVYSPSPHAGLAQRRVPPSRASDDNQLGSGTVPQRLNSSGRGYRREVPMSPETSGDLARSRAPLSPSAVFSVPPAPQGVRSPTHGSYPSPLQGSVHNNAAGQQPYTDNGNHTQIRGTNYPSSPIRQQHHHNNVRSISQVPNRDNYERLHHHTPVTSQRPFISNPSGPRELNTSRGSSDNLSVSDVQNAHYHSRSASSNISYDRSSTSPLCGHNDSRSSEEFEILSPTSV